MADANTYEYTYTMFQTPASFNRMVSSMSSLAKTVTPLDIAPAGLESRENTRESSNLDSWRRRASEVGAECIVIKGMKRDYRIPTDDLYPDPDLLTSWYTLDTNHVPPVYRLNLIR